MHNPKQLKCTKKLEKNQGCILHSSSYHPSQTTKCTKEYFEKKKNTLGIAYILLLLLLSVSRFPQTTKCTKKYFVIFLICAVKGQAFSLLGRLEGLGAGAAAAQGRRSQAARQEQLWRRQRQAHALCVRQGRDILRRGQIHFP